MIWERIIEHLWGKDVYRETECGINTMFTNYAPSWLTTRDSHGIFRP